VFGLQVTQTAVYVTGVGICTESHRGYKK